MSNKELLFNDMENLEKILKSELQIKDLDLDSKQRLIKLCHNRVKEVNKKIKNKEEQISQLEEIIKDIKRG